MDYISAAKENRIPGLIPSFMPVAKNVEKTGDQRKEFLKGKE